MCQTELHRCPRVCLLILSTGSSSAQQQELFAVGLAPTNWTMKYVSINGQIVVMTVQSGNLKYTKYQDVEAEVEEQMQKWQTRNSSQRLWAVVRRDLEEEEEKRDGLRVVKRRSHYRETKEKAGTSSWMSMVISQHAWETAETTMKTKQKNGRPERKRRRTTQASHHWWRCSAVSENNWER